MCVVIAVTEPVLDMTIQIARNTLKRLIQDLSVTVIECIRLIIVVLIIVMLIIVIIIIIPIVQIIIHRVNPSHFSFMRKIFWGLKILSRYSLLGDSKTNKKTETEVEFNNEKLT